MDVLLTGGTGLLGETLLQKLTSQNEVDTIYCLVRDIGRASVALEAFEKVELLAGDITLPSFGLQKEDIGKLEKVHEFYHLAAIVSLSTSEEKGEEIRSTNVNGTINALSIAAQLPNLEKMFFVSTAYAGGYENNKIPEDWIPKPKKFRNFYEQSKWEAEEQIRAHSDKVKCACVIIRPSIVLGKTVENWKSLQKYTVYLYAYLLNRCVRGSTQEQIRIAGDPASSLNFIFVNDLAQTIMASRDSEQSRIINAVAKNGIATADILKSIKKGLRTSAEFVLNPDLSLSEMTPVEAAIHKYTAAFTPYLSHETNWITDSHSESITSENDTSEAILHHIEEFCERMVNDE